MVSRKNVLFTVSLFSLLELGGCSQLNQSGNCTMSGQYADQQSCQTKNPSANCSLSTAVSPDGQTLACWKVVPKVTTNQQSSSPTVCTSTWEEGAWGKCDGKLQYRQVTCKTGCTCNEKTKPATSASCGEYLAGGFHTKQQCLANRGAKIELMNGESYCGMSGSICPASWKTLTKNGFPYTTTYNNGSLGTVGYAIQRNGDFVVDPDRLKCTEIESRAYFLTGRKTYEPKPVENHIVCKKYEVTKKDRKGCILNADCIDSVELFLRVQKLLCY